MTVGTGFFTYRNEINGTNVALQLWDLAEQNQFRFFLDRFAYGARGAILAFDASNIDSFLALERTWIPFLETNLPHAPVILISTRGEDENQVTDEMVIDLIANSILEFCGYYSISIQDRSNANEPFDMLTRAMLGDFGSNLSHYQQQPTGRSITQFLANYYCPLCGKNGLYIIQEKKGSEPIYRCYQCKNTIY